MTEIDFINSLDSAFSDPIQSLKIIESDDLWKNDERFIFRIARHLIRELRYQDFLNLVRTSKTKGFHFSGKHQVDFLHMQGDALLELNKYDEAIDVYRMLIEDAPDFVSYNNLALALWKKGEFESSLENYVVAVSLNETDPIPLRGAGEMLNRLDRFGEAIPYLIAAVNLKPDYLQALRSLGVAYYHTGHRGASYRTFKRVLAIKPDDPIAIKGLNKLDEASDCETGA